MEQEIQGLVGLEIHVYLVTREKLFCECRAVKEKGMKPNSFICPICTGQPGAKPMLPNKTAVEKAVQVALMLGCKVNERMNWQRKHYNWPDLPRGYQNTLSGPRAFPVGENGKFMGIRIREMHLEEDPAAWNPETGEVDYNRSGFPLIEIVTEPDFSTSEEVMSWLKSLFRNLEYLKAVASDSGLKADVNVNLIAPKKTQRVEVKNVNSIENIGMAIEYEFARQMKEGSVLETRRFDTGKGVTSVMRSKEGADDYRFIADPDLQDIVLEKKFISEQKGRLPESPEEKLEKLIKKFKIGKDDAGVLAKNLDVVEFYESVVQELALKSSAKKPSDFEKVANEEANFALHWVTVELLRYLNYNKVKLETEKLRVEDFVELLESVKSGKITELQGKQILNEFYPKSFSLKERGVEGKISDSGELERVCLEVLKKEKEVTERYKAGDKKLINFLVGEVMKRTEKRADFRVVLKVMEKLLD